MPGKWTDQDLTELVDTLKNGGTKQQYADAHNRTVAVVTRRVNKYLCEQTDKGFSDEDISNELHINVQEVAKVVSSHRLLRQIAANNAKRDAEMMAGLGNYAANCRQLTENLNFMKEAVAKIHAVREKLEALDKA